MSCYLVRWLFRMACHCSPETVIEPSGNANAASTQRRRCRGIATFDCGHQFGRTAKIKICGRHVRAHLRRPSAGRRITSGQGLRCASVRSMVTCCDCIAVSLGMKYGASDVIVSSGGKTLRISIVADFLPALLLRFRQFSHVAPAQVRGRLPCFFAHKPFEFVPLGLPLLYVG